MTSNGLAVARSLGQRGIPLFLLDNPSDRPAMRSRSGSAVPMPDLCAEPDVWLATLLELAQRLSGPPGVPILIPTGDEHVLWVSEHRDLLARHARFRLPDGDLARRLVDKRLQFELLAAHGCPLPRSVAIEDGDDVERLARESVGFPCVLKPRASHSWMRHRTGRKLTVANNASELRRNHEEMRATGEPLFLQELIPGDDSTLHGSIAYCADGEPLALFTKQKLRQYPTGCGNGSFQVSTQNREVAELSTGILRSLRYDGMVSIELKWDYRDERFKLIEINPRGVSGNQLAVDSGLDLPYIAYQHARGADLPPPAAYRAGVHYLHLPWDLLAFLSLRRRGELTFLAWLRSLLRARSFALFSARDPAPSLFYVLMVLRKWRQGELAGKL